MRSYSPDFCYKQNDWKSANKRDPYIVNITKNPNFTKAIDAFSNYVNQTVDFYTIYEYYDSAECLIYMGKQPLKIFTEDNDVAHDLAKIATLSNYMTFFYN